MITFSDYLNHLKYSNVRKPKVKIELLRIDETPYAIITGDVINSGGTLNIENKKGQRRNINFDLINVTKKYLPNPDGIWIRQKIRLWLGLEINNEDFFIQQGIFVLNNPSVFSGPGENRVSISASDKFSLLDGSLGGELNGIYKIPVDRSILTAVKMILKPSEDSLLEVCYDPINPLIHESFNSITLPYTLEKGMGEPIGDMLIELADMVSANVYYSVDGQLVFEPDYDDNIKGVLHSFQEGDFNYINSNQEYPLNKIYNAVLVVGDNVNGETFDSLVENTDLRSSTSIPNVGFRRVLVVTDTNIQSTVLALARANYELKRVTNLFIEQSLESLPIYHLDVDNLILLTDSNLNLNNKKMIVNSISLPIATDGSMSIKCVDTVELIASNEELPV